MDHQVIHIVVEDKDSELFPPVEDIPGPTPASTTTEGFASVSNTINVNGKYEGKQAWNTTTKRPVWASGSSASDAWVYADGTTAHEPI